MLSLFPSHHLSVTSFHVASVSSSEDWQLWTAEISFLQQILSSIHTLVHMHTLCLGHAATTMHAHTSHFGCYFEYYLPEKYWNSGRLGAEQYEEVELGEERKEDVLSIQWPQLAVPLFFFQNIDFVDCYD